MGLFRTMQDKERAITKPMMYNFSMDYDAILDNGLDSKAGGWGRGLQTLALLLGEAGHLVDIYTQNPNKISYQYPGVKFFEYGIKSKKVYDLVFWNGWVTDSPTQEGRLYLYLEFFKNWENRVLQKFFYEKKMYG